MSYELDHIAYDAAAVTPSDTLELPKTDTEGLYIGTGGNIALVMQSGSAVTFTGVVAGSVLNLRVKQIKALGTTASNIVALY